MALGAALACLLAACDATPYREVDVPLSVQEATAATAPRRAPVFRLSIAAMESPRGTFASYRRLVERLGERLGMRVELVQRPTYREVNDLLAAGELDAALMCAGGYLDLARRDASAAEVVAVPVVHGRTTFSALIVVPAAGTARRVEDLAGARFAFTDELSFSGHAYPRYLLRKSGLAPESFFGTTLLTHSHDRSIRAVADGVVDGAAVHSVIFERLAQREPEVAARVRVIHRSPAFGSMPLVVSTRLSRELRARFRDALFALAADPAAADALRALEIDRFAPPEPALFDAVRAIEAAR